MLARIENDKGVHLEPQINVRACLSGVLVERESAFFIRCDFAEEIDVRDEVAFS
jgi:hypothetical protein